MLGFILILALQKVLYTMKIFFRFIFWLILLGFLACKTDPNESLANALVIRIKADLSGLNPVNHSGGNALRVMNNVLPSLVDFDPVSGEMVPLLIDELPKRHTDTTKVVYSFRFRDEAKWPNGSPITVDDYIFSLKVAFNRKIRGNGWTRPLSIIQDVLVDSVDSRACTVVLKKDFANVVGYFAGFELLPAYHYDPKQLLKPYPLKQFLTVESFDKLWVGHPEITEFANSFSQEKYIRSPDGVVGAGPYRLAEWTSNEQIVLVKKENYWADGLVDITPILAGYPDTIIYKIVGDDVATSLLIKNAGVDVVPNINDVAFLKLKNDTDVSKKYNFYTPSSPKINMVLLNTQSPKLGKSVRNALARCIDLDQVIEVASSGLGAKVISPLGVKSVYYNRDLKPIEKNIEKAKELLANDGWMDANGDGILEKEINGQTIPLKLSLVVSANSIGKLVVPILKKSAEKVGIRINVVAVESRETLSRLRSPKFEMAFVGITTPPTDYNPYGSWHSENAGKKGKNYTRFSSSKMDQVIEGLMVASTVDEKKILYKEFQEILYDEQPVLFLFSPVKKIIVKKRWEPMITSVRPGYFDNAFRLKKD